MATWTRVMAVAFSWLAAAATGAGAYAWKPVSPEELVATASQLEPDASAEVLFREIEIDHDGGGDAFVRSYLRIKVFTQRGMEELRILEVPRLESDSVITRVVARVTKPDGTVTALEPDDVFTRLVSVEDRDVSKTTRFTLPGLAPGAVVEFQYTERMSGFGGAVFLLSMPYPTDVVRIRIRPARPVRAVFFRCKDVPLRPERGGYFELAWTNFPSTQREDFAPPAQLTDAWVMLYYGSNAGEAPDVFWQNVGREDFRTTETRTRPGREVRRVAAELLNGARTDGEKLDRIGEYCRTRIRNLALPESQATEAEREASGYDRDAQDTIAHGYGWDSDVRDVFIALARAAGFDARLARCAQRDRAAFDPHSTLRMNLRERVVAVKLDGAWRYFAPEKPAVRWGMLDWLHEGQAVLISDPKTPEFRVTPLSTMEDNGTRRTAKLRLDSSGDLEGEVEVHYRGQRSAQKANSWKNLTPDGRAASIRGELQSGLSTAELSDITVSGLAGPPGAVSVRYHLKVPAYAAVAGRRLLVAPSIFEQGRPSLFRATARILPVFFPFRWSEEDRVEITLPADFELENAESPAGIPANGNLVFEPRLFYRATDATLIFERRFGFGLGWIDPDKYAAVKGVFDHVNHADQLVLSLRQTADRPAATPSFPATEAPVN